MLPKINTPVLLLRRGPCSSLRPWRQAGQKCNVDIVTAVASEWIRHLIIQTILKLTRFRCITKLETGEVEYKADVSVHVVCGHLTRPLSDPRCDRLRRDGLSRQDSMDSFLTILHFFLVTSWDARQIFFFLFPCFICSQSCEIGQLNLKPGRAFASVSTFHRAAEKGSPEAW